MEQDSGIRLRCCEWTGEWLSNNLLMQFRRHPGSPSGPAIDQETTALAPLTLRDWPFGFFKDVAELQFHGRRHRWTQRYRTPDENTCIDHEKGGDAIF